MKPKYDVIVIGAGLGGLSAASMLAKNGLGVLLLEKHNVLGGYATSFVRGRYEFEVALHELSGIGPPEYRGGLYRYLDYLGVAEKVEFINIPHLYRSVFPDLDITLPVGKVEFLDTLCTAFPQEALGINRFLQRIFDLRNDFIKMVKSRGAGNSLTMPVRLPHFTRYLPATWGQILNRDVRDQKARAVLSQYWGYVGMPPSKVSFLYFATTIASYILRGPAFPQGRSQALSNAFIEAFEAAGGEARMNCGVERVTVSNGTVSGVITEEQEEIAADLIISNVDPITTCRDMIGVDKVPGEFFTKMQSSEIAASTLNVYLGVARSHEELNLTEHEIFLNTDYNFDQHYQLMFSVSPPSAIAVTCYNTIYPKISPEGTSIVVLTALMFGEPWYKVSPEDYIEAKNRIADGMIDMAEKVAPGLRQYTEVVEVSTPITNMRYAGAPGGSIYGFNQPPRDNIVWRMGHRGPLEGLYFVGAWTQPGGGFEPAISSGQIAAGRILNSLKKMHRGV